jgi:hypothetical protein
MNKTYANYLTHVQTKDKKFIQPPLKITNLTTSTQECNPDKDILVNKPTIQINTSVANIHDQNGNYIATINIDRLQWLWSQFTHNNQQHLTNFLHPPPQDFETEVLWLLQRYVTILPKKKPKTIQPQNLHHTLHPEIIKTLITTFQITHSYYSSPLTCPIQITQFHSPHNRDIIFGSLGHAKSSKWTGIGLAFPTDYNTTVEAIHWARMAAKEDPTTVTILIANHKDWTTQNLPLTTKPDVHVMTTIPPHTIKYKPTPEWPTYYQYDEPALTSIICIHNQATLSPNVRTPHTLKQILQQLTNTHIETHPIMPNSTQYKVKISNIWKNTPKVSIPHTNNHTTIPIPNTYKHTHPLKFPPQQCVYTDGSFIPPTKKLRRTNCGQHCRIGSI